MEPLSTQKAATLTGVPERTLNYWASTGLLSPSRRDGRGGYAGKSLRWPLEEMMLARTIREITQVLPPDVLRPFLDDLRGIFREAAQDPSCLDNLTPVLLYEPTELHLCRSSKEVQQLWENRKRGQQMITWGFEEVQELAIKWKEVKERQDDRTVLE